MRKAFTTTPSFTKQRCRLFPWLGLATLLLFTAACTVVPRPFSAKEFKEQSLADLERLFVDQEPVQDRINLYEAMARAIKYNLDHKVKSLERALAQGNLVQAHSDMLPQLVASAGYSERNNVSGSVSKSLITGAQSLESSTSQERDQTTTDLIYVWNILDFGVGYVQAQQLADEVLIADEWRRKAVQNIIQDLRYAYWRAVSAERLLPEMNSLLQRVESALERSRQVERLRAQEPAKLLDYQQELLETVQQLWAMRRDLTLAKTELATLMNLKPGASFRLVDTTKKISPFSEHVFSVDSLEQKALVNRPELRAEAYQKRIGSLEARKAMLRMLPGVEINLSAQHDNNPFLYNNTWAQIGTSLSWNIYSLFSRPAAIKTAEIQQELSGRRHMALSMMVLTQVNLANQRYQLAAQEFRIASQLNEVHDRKIMHTEAARKARTANELDEIRNRAAALSARMRLGIAYAELQGALGRIFHSIGTDPIPTAGANDIKAIAQNLKKEETNLLVTLQKTTADGIKAQPAYLAETESLPETDAPQPTPATEKIMTAADTDGKETVADTPLAAEISSQEPLVQETGERESLPAEPAEADQEETRYSIISLRSVPGNDFPRTIMYEGVIFSTKEN